MQTTCILLLVLLHNTLNPNHSPAEPYMTLLPGIPVMILSVACYHMATVRPNQLYKIKWSTYCHTKKYEATWTRCAVDLDCKCVYKYPREK